MRALSFLAPKGLRQKRISQEQFAKPGKLTAISCFLLGSECAPHGGVGLGSGAAKATLNAIPVRCSKSIFIQLEAMKRIKKEARSLLLNSGMGDLRRSRPQPDTAMRRAFRTLT
jgi:hypothetical protein